MASFSQYIWSISGKLRLFTSNLVQDDDFVYLLRLTFFHLGTRSACINAAMLALADPGISVYYSFTRYVRPFFDILSMIFYLQISVIYNTKLWVNKYFGYIFYLHISGMISYLWAGVYSNKILYFIYFFNIFGCVNLKLRRLFFSTVSTHPVKITWRFASFDLDHNERWDLSFEWLLSVAISALVSFFQCQSICRGFFIFCLFACMCVRARAQNLLALSVFNFVDLPFFF